VSYTSKDFPLFLDGKDVNRIYLNNPEYSAGAKSTTYNVNEIGKESLFSKTTVIFKDEEKEDLLKNYIASGLRVRLEKSNYIWIYSNPRISAFILFSVFFISFSLSLIFSLDPTNVDKKLIRDKEDIVKFLNFIFKRRLFEWLALSSAGLSLVFLIFSSATTYNPESFSLYLKNKDPKNLVFEGISKDQKSKTTTFCIREKGSFSFLSKKEIVLPDEYKDAFIYNYIDAGSTFNLENSFYQDIRNNTKKVVLFISLLFTILLILIVFKENAEKKEPSSLSPSGLNGSPLSSGENQKPVQRHTFSDVAGIDEVKEQIEEIVNLFKDSSKIQEMGGRIPMGVLLNGPPGTGKTLLAKVTASESNANFIQASGSEFVEMYVGVGAKRVRELFNRARKMAPCIIFIDEIDAVAGKRGIDNNSEREQTLNELLVQMDGFNNRDNILVFAATNQLDKLDPAILRPGRFDRKISVYLPDAKGREKILKIYLDKTKVKSVNVKLIARATNGFSGADLSNLVNEAILFAARSGRNFVSQKDLIWAKDKIIMGSERKLSLSKDDLKKTAFHEIGHAFICQKLGIAKLVNVSIVPRGKALGVTQMESQDLYTLSKERAIEQIAMLMGGRVCEKIFFDHYSTGASNDLQRAFSLARNMVAYWGMSDLGPLGLDESFYRVLSESTKSKIEDESLKIVKAAEDKAYSILMENKELVEYLSNLLLEKETLSEKEVSKFISMKLSPTESANITEQSV
jgi:cell division protease FtsH